MKNLFKLIGIIAIVAVMGFGFAACGGDDGGGGNKTYVIGDTGPGGGKVFYDKGSVSDGWRYLEAAPQILNITWCSCTAGNFCDVTTGTIIGTGKANTAAIIAASHKATITALNCAAKACDEYSNNGKSDWFLPSFNELGELLHARLDDMESYRDALMSSSQLTSSGVYNLSFPGGGQGSSGKAFSGYFRPIRAF